MSRGIAIRISASGPGGSFLESFEPSVTDEFRTFQGLTLVHFSAHPEPFFVTDT